jgi:hypothetical protein
MIRCSILILFVFFSCTQDAKVPDNILPPEKMEKLLLDVLRVEEFYNQKKNDSSAIDSFSLTSLYQAVLVQHKTSKENFAKSFKFYEKHPELLKTVLDSMHSVADKADDEINKRPVLKNEDTSATKGYKNE